MSLGKKEKLRGTQNSRWELRHVGGAIQTALVGCIHSVTYLTYISFVDIIILLFFTFNRLKM